MTAQPPRLFNPQNVVARVVPDAERQAANQYIVYNGFGSECGRALGGIVNAVTESSHDNWRGSIDLRRCYGFFTDSIRLDPSHRRKSWITDYHNLGCLDPETSQVVAGFCAGRNPKIRNTAPSAMWMTLSTVRLTLSVSAWAWMTLAITLGAMNPTTPRIR